jgi:hypothetical protein
VGAGVGERRYERKKREIRYEREDTRERKREI